MRARCYLIILLLIAGLVGGGCGGKGANQATPSPTSEVAPTETVSPTSMPNESIGSEIVVLTPGTLTTLDPYYMVPTPSENSIAAHLWDTLVWLNDDLDLEPRLAESWWLVNDLTWEFKLRSGIKFHNGEEFNAQAVKFSIERTASLESSLETFASDVTLDSVEIVDDYTVRIHTLEPSVSMPYELTTVEMLPPAYYGQKTAEELARNPVGSGPYRLVSWDKDNGLVMEANPDYWQSPPAIKTLVFRTIPDLETRLAALEDGTADLITDLPPDRAEAANTANSHLEAIESLRRIFVGIRFEEGTPFADKRVRQALNYAVDTDAIIEALSNGYGQRYGSWVNPPHANSGLKPWPYDPEKARSLLTEAGYANGFTTIMDTPIGRYYKDEEVAKAIASYLAEVGIQVEVRSHDWPTYVRDFLIPKKTDPLFLLSLNSRADGLEDVRNLTFEFPFNPTKWYNSEFEKLVREAGVTFNQTKRQSLLEQAQSIAYEEAPWIWLWRPYLFYGVSNDLAWQPRADGLVYLYQPASTEAGNP